MRVTVAAAEAGVRLEQLIATRLSRKRERALPRSAARRLVMAGVVRRGGLPLRRPGLPVEPGWVLEVLVDHARLTSRRPDRDFALGPSDILYQDAALLAVAKPAGVPTVPTADASRPSLVRAVQAWLVAHGERPYLAVHQRLDRETSGVVLFARAPRANAALAAAFAQRRVEKTYMALTARPAQRPEDHFRMASPIEGRAALTDVAVVRRLRGGLLVEARPRTGRKHQVRIHLARAGLGILGDDRYGSASDRAPRLMLHAAHLELDHPITGGRLRITCAPPADFRGLLGLL